ncbi:MAG: Spy/CpxP family protein refolding chaperone [Desulfomonilia bacterium]
MKRIITLIGILIFTGAVAVPVFAHGPRDGAEGRYGDCQRLEKGDRSYGCQFSGREAAGLSEEQREQLRDLRDVYVQQVDPIREQIVRKKTELRDEIARTTPDEAKVKTLTSEISTLRGELAQARIARQLEVKKIVPDAQFGQAKRYWHRKGGFAGCDRPTGI